MGGARRALMCNFRGKYDIVDTAYKKYFSANPRDQIFGACTNALSVRFSGYSCHPLTTMKP
eukprot:1157641-Pelagomonas_calceolata.AAC.1